MSRTYPVSLFAALALAFSAGCGEPTTGAAGNIAFTPANCGIASGCDFDDTVGAGGQIDVRIAGIGGFDVSDMTLESGNTEVFTVSSLGMVNGMPTWQLEGQSAGTASLIARKDDARVDHITVEVQEVTGLLVRPFLTEIDPVDPPLPEYDWQAIVDPGQSVSLNIIPAVGDRQVMGRYDYLYEIIKMPDEDESMDYGYIVPVFESYMTDQDLDKLNEGWLTFTVPADAPAAEYKATFTPAFYEDQVLIELGLVVLPE